MPFKHTPLIVFSGIDGGGKSTQVERLITRMRSEGEKPVYIWTRGGYTPKFNALKEILRRFSHGRILPPIGQGSARDQAFKQPWKRKLWLVLAILELGWIYAIQIRWLMWRNHPVICDRYYWDSLIDFRLNFPQENVSRWWLWRLLVRHAPRPTAAFLLLIPVSESIRRSNIKGEPFRESAELLTRRLVEYQYILMDSDLIILNGKDTPDEIANMIREVLKDKENPQRTTV
jgi:dTMP kinase